jgi:hypothetical protein
MKKNTRKLILKENLDYFTKVYKPSKKMKKIILKDNEMNRCLQRRIRYMETDLDQRAEFFAEYEKGFFPKSQKGITNFLESRI